MAVSAESRSTGTLTIHKYEQGKDAKPGVEGMGKKVKAFQREQSL